MGRRLDWLLYGPSVAAAAADRPAPVLAAGRPPVRAAGQVAVTPTATTPAALPIGIGTGLLPVDFGPFAYNPFIDRAAAMTIPTVSRARDLICGAVGELPITAWSYRPPEVERMTPPPSWAYRPDPNRTRQWLLAWTADDLLFYGAAYWRIIDRYATRYPSKFQRLAFTDVHVDDAGRVTYLGEEVAADDVVEFLSPIEGMLYNGWRALSIALNLDDSADRFASNEIPNGVLEEQEGGEDLTADELTAMATDFAIARRANTIASTNKYVRFREISTDPSKMQLVEGRGYQALEMARLGNVPPYLVGAPAGTGMTYQNTAQARADLLDFGAIPYVGCIEQTLSGPNVTPGGTIIRLDTNAWLRSPFSEGAPTDQAKLDQTTPDTPGVAP